MQFVSLSLQITKLYHNQLTQNKMVLLYKIRHLKSKQFHVLKYEPIMKWNIDYEPF